MLSAIISSTATSISSNCCFICFETKMPFSVKATLFLRLSSDFAFS
ncbi:AgrD family cyclic lactone autoinducer peptide [Flavobacterium sp. TR2]